MIFALIDEIKEWGTAIRHWIRALTCPYYRHEFRLGHCAIENVYCTPADCPKNKSKGENK